MSICRFISSSVGNFSKISFEIYFSILYEDTPIGLLTPSNAHSTDNLSFSLHKSNPIFGLSISFF